MELNKEIVGKRLRKQRELLSMSREAFSELIDISPQFLAEIENGKKGMSAETLYKICSKCPISTDYLLLGRVNVPLNENPVTQMLSSLNNEELIIFEEMLTNFLKIVRTEKSLDKN